MQKRILIIGAGATGSICADILHSTFPLSNIVVWDKARGSGGRMTTTRSSLGNSADLGAQYITSTKSDLKEHQHLYEPLLAKGVLTPLTGRVEGMKAFPGDVQHFVAPSGMGSVVKFFLAQSKATVEFNRYVSTICVNEKHYEVETQDGYKGFFDVIISTMPIPQLFGLQLSLPLSDDLKSVEYSSRFVLIFFYDKILQPFTDWVAKYVANDTFRYVTWDQLKRNQSEEKSSVVFHTSVDYGLANKIKTKSDVEEELVEKARALFPDWPKPTEVKCHKWLYSQVIQPLSASDGKPCRLISQTPPFILAGDAFTTSNLNGCIRSAKGAVQELAQFL